MKTKKLYIITGLSGSGKTTAVQAFEDASFCCIDNMPMELAPKFLELPLKQGEDIKGIAFVMDMRLTSFIQNFAPGIKAMKDLGVSPRIIFLEADKDILVNRYSQTRRLHPLSREGGLIDSILLEKKTMEPVRQAADHIIDTTGLNVHELKAHILSLIGSPNQNALPMKLNLVSFGFKYGIPSHADLVIDVRFLNNPYFIPELKPLDGDSQAVKDFVLSAPETRTFLEKYTSLLDYLIPLYKKENKAYLTIAVGCTGGRHRSVAIARSIFEHLNQKGLSPGIVNRDIDRDIKEK